MLEDVEGLGGLLDINRVTVVSFVCDVGLMFLQRQGVAVHDKPWSEYLFAFSLDDISIMGFLLIVIFLILIAIIDDPFRMIVIKLIFLLDVSLRVRFVEGIRELLFDFFDFGEEHIDGG